MGSKGKTKAARGPLENPFTLEGLEDLTGHEAGLDTAEGIKKQLADVAVSALGEGRYNESTQALRELAKLNGFDKQANSLESLSHVELNQRFIEAIGLLQGAGLKL